MSFPVWTIVITSYSIHYTKLYEWLLSVAAVIVSLLVILYQLYKYNLDYSIPLIVKQIGVYVPLVIAVMLFTSWYIQKDSYNFV